MHMPGKVGKVGGLWRVVWEPGHSTPKSRQGRPKKAREPLPLNLEMFLGGGQVMENQWEEGACHVALHSREQNLKGHKQMGALRVGTT